MHNQIFYDYFYSIIAFFLGGKQWWDPYETSHKRQFVHQPSSAPPSTSLIDSYSQSGPFGSSVYSKDFSWKPACKPECIRTGTASGQRRNNPHPSKVGTEAVDASRSSEYISFPLKRLPSEGEIRKALTAQYRSTYQCDFMGTPPGTSFWLSQSNVYESLSEELKISVYSGISRLHQMIILFVTVPAVVSRNLHVQQKGANVTTYDQFFGKRVNNMTSVIKSLMPQELQQLHRILPKKG
uniref:Uncharacterized protein n=1 Tax=Amphilophus citrinellus TaxID=61819 RepID=A0A3Q0R7I8_AMPCI